MGTKLDQETILQATQNWPESERMELIRALLKEIHEEGHLEELSKLARFSHVMWSLYSTQKFERPRMLSYMLRGILASDQPTPSDEDVARILDEERGKKYGV